VAKSGSDETNLDYKQTKIRQIQIAGREVGLRWARCYFVGIAVATSAGRYEGGAGVERQGSLNRGNQDTMTTEVATKEAAWQPAPTAAGHAMLLHRS
jgi:hypothetical protein